MTQDEIIEMPEYLNASYEGDDLYTGDQVRELMKLVAAKERERYMQLFLDPENQPTQFGTATQEYREQEVKELQSLLTELAHIVRTKHLYGPEMKKLLEREEAIRARGKQ
jgi:hypothetical protein